MRSTAWRVASGGFSALLAVSMSWTGVSGTADSLLTGPTGDVYHYQTTNDGQGDASVVVDLGSRTTSNDIEINADGPNSRASTDSSGGGPSASLADMASQAAIAQVVNPGLGLAQIPIDIPAGAPITALVLEPSFAGGSVSDGVAVDGISTSGQTGINVSIGDTAGGSGEPGAPGGDAHVLVRVGDVTGGSGVGGEAIAGEAIDLITPAGVGIDLAAAGLLSGIAPSGSARLGSLVAIGGSASGGAARGGDATVDITIGDTTGGAGANGHAGGDAIVLVDIGSVTGGVAIGGNAIGGNALRGPGSAIAGNASGGAARGGNAAVNVHVGDITGVDGAGSAGNAAMAVTIGSLTGGTARGGAATGGDAWGLLDIDSRGGDAAGGDATGGNAFLDLRIVDMVGGGYRGEVGAIVGGDATGGDSIGGDSIDLTVNGL